jgi:hypothetical protein
MCFGIGMNTDRESAGNSRLCASASADRGKDAAQAEAFLAQATLQKPAAAAQSD